MQQGKAGTTDTTNRASAPTQPPSPLINLPSLGEDDSNLSLPPLTRPRRRRRWIILIVVFLLLLLLAGILIRVSSRGQSVNYQYAQATQGNLTRTVNATGPIQSGVYNLIFSGTGGKIDEIDVSIGQKVVKGQVLARLDKTLLQDAVDQAQIGVNNAQASLNAAIAGANSSSGQSNASVSAAQTAVSDAKESQRQTQAQGDASVATAQTTLDNAETNLTQVTNTSEQQKTQALETYQAAATTNSCPADPNTITDSSTLSAPCQTAYNTYIASVNQANASVTTAQAQVNSAQAALKQAQANATAQNATAQNQVNTAESQLTSAQAGQNVSGTTGQSQVITAQNQLNTALAQLKQARHNLANATLKAPHAGIVTIINGTVGGTPGASTSGVSTGGEFIQLVDLTALQVQADVNEADIANLQVGESASFTVNAYGQQEFTGTVSSISPNGQTISNVVTYPVRIDVDPNSLKGAHLLPDMTANVTINAVQHNNVLLLPVNAINFARLASSGNTTSGTPQLISAQSATASLNQARQMLESLEVANPDLVSEGPLPAFVIEKSGSRFIAKPVVLGLTDGASYEVLQGLSPSDTFIVGIGG
ncbi:MAG TPA: efflux RND transporter periplasmic adaptor subunit [Ktedonobacteraceae bacterium]